MLTGRKNRTIFLKSYKLHKIGGCDSFLSYSPNHKWKVYTEQRCNDKQEDSRNTDTGRWNAHYVCLEYCFHVFWTNKKIFHLYMNIIKNSHV